MGREPRHTAAFRRACLTCGLAAIVALALCANALAAGKAVNVGTPFSSGPPSVAVDSSGNALIAWANTRDLGNSLNIVQYCVLPPDATACSHSGSLQPADSAQFIDGVHVLNDGGTMVILADIFGAAGNNAGDYTPDQEWQSTDGGASWPQVNGGLSVTSGILNADTGPLSAVIVPGTGVLGFGWDTAAGAPTFNAFPLTGPPECSVATCPAGFATLEPDTNPDTLGNPQGQFAGEAGAQPGVMGIFATNFTNGPLGCAKSFGTAYVYGAGNQSASNSYNISPGQPGSAWRVALAQADCDVENPAVGGGPSGFGVLESNEGNASTAYHRFNAVTSKFDTPLVTVANQTESDAALSQDGAGGIYGTYLLDGPGGPINLSYSADGGKTFTSGVLNPNPDGKDDQVTSSVNGAGQGWAAWVNNGSVFAQPFQAADAISPASVGGGATDNGTTVTVTVTCTSLPCTVTITITSSTVTVHTSAMALKKKKKPKNVTLARGKFTITKSGAHKLSVKLTTAGKGFLASKKGHLKVGSTITETVAKHTKVITRNLTMTIKPKKAKK